MDEREALAAHVARHARCPVCKGTGEVADRSDTAGGTKLCPRTIKGFATLDSERMREIASMGGKRAHALGVAHTFSNEAAVSAGRLGGKRVSQNREHMRRIGREGGRKRAENRKDRK